MTKTRIEEFLDNCFLFGSSRDFLRKVLVSAAKSSPDFSEYEISHVEIEKGEVSIYYLAPISDGGDPVRFHVSVGKAPEQEGITYYIRRDENRPSIRLERKRV